MRCTPSNFNIFDIYWASFNLLTIKLHKVALKFVSSFILLFQKIPDFPYFESGYSNENFAYQYRPFHFVIVIFDIDFGLICLTFSPFLLFCCSSNDKDYSSCHISEWRNGITTVTLHFYAVFNWQEKIMLITIMLWS